MRCFNQVADILRRRPTAFCDELLEVRNASQHFKLKIAENYSVVVEAIQHDVLLTVYNLKITEAATQPEDTGSFQER